MTAPIVRYLNGTGADGSGRTIEQVLSFSDERLELTHDYIQWLFPLREPSAIVPDAPTLTDDDIDAIRSDPRAQQNLIRALARMRLFYAGAAHWLVPGNHNHLRITRIIASVFRLHHPSTAREFLEFIKTRVESSPGSITSRTAMFWEEAARGSI